jgi:hypothetical protein
MFALQVSSNAAICLAHWHNSLCQAYQFHVRVAWKLLDAVLQLMGSLMQRIWNIILGVHLVLLH